MSVDLCHFINCWCQSRADSPDRFIGNDGVFCRGAFGQRSLDLSGHDLEGFVFLVLIKGFSDADNGGQLVAMGGLGLGGDILVGFAIVSPSF